MRKLVKNQRGVTLVELVVATVIFSVVALSFGGAMSGIVKSIHISKARTLATNLAQEKVESLKNLSYYRLLVTTSPTTSAEADIDPFLYDEGYYGEENLEVGQINFIRRVYIEKVTENSGDIDYVNWQSDDTGLKRITTHVLWQQGQDWKKVSIVNVRDNPTRKVIDSVIGGNVESGGLDISDADVIVLQNPLYEDSTNGGGEFSIDIGAGTYDVRASKSGYFPQTLSVTVDAANPGNLTFDLDKMAVGAVHGIAVLNDRLLVSKVVAAVDGDENLEYMEIYNPTNQAYEIKTATGAISYFFGYVRASDNNLALLNTIGQTCYVNTIIPAKGYYLIASSAIVNANGTPVQADAYYSDGTETNIVPDNRIPIDEEGGVAIYSLGIYEDPNLFIDSVAWGKNPIAGGYGTEELQEGGGIKMSAWNPNNGMLSDQAFERIAYSSSVVADMDLTGPGPHKDEGNAYDSNVNSADFVLHEDILNDTPRNTGDSAEPGSGGRARGGLVFLDDGLSGSGSVVDVPMIGTFSVTNIATGTWTILASSNGFVYTNNTVVITAGLDLDLGTIHLNEAATSGFIAGQVVKSGGGPISNILVEASGETDTTDSNGRFNLPMDEGLYIVTANPGNANSLYTTDVTTSVTVVAGQITALANPLTLYLGGQVEGFISTNGTDPLPGIPIVATSSLTGAEVGSTVSDVQGMFYFSNLPVANYTFTPQLETGEQASPYELTATAVSGSSVHAGTMTVSSAFGQISGNVTDDGELIRTGVLLVAVPSPSTISGSDPPEITSSIRGGSTYYYVAASDSAGEFSISLRGGITYNVYGWYTEFVNGSPSTSKKSAVVTVNTGGSTSQDFSWP